jgi:superfamily I DNA/RNA helicase
MLHSKSRFIGAGDFLQAIYGFGGSDCLSMQKSIQDTNSKVLPLNICYRCPSSHVEFLKPLAPHIETWEGANPGILQYLDEEKLEDTLQEKDYVLCRKTAPLVKLCISLIKQRKPATVKGKNIGKQLVNMFIQISEMRKFTYKDYPIFHNLFRDREIDKIKKRDRGDVKEQISTFSDKLDALYACYESFATETADQLKDAILNLFSDKDSLITLSTIHRFKGLEAKRVFILEWNSLSFKALEDKWQSQQEVNVSFVGLSRSLKEMYLVQRNAPPVKTVPTLIKESKSSVVSIYDLLAEEDSLKTLEEWLEEDLELVGSTEEINYLEHCLAKS